jgi:hypothetical protein
VERGTYIHDNGTPSHHFTKGELKDLFRKYHAVRFYNDSSELKTHDFNRGMK